MNEFIPHREHMCLLESSVALITFMEIKWGVFKAHSRHCEKPLLTTSPSLVCLSVRKKQCGVHLDGFALNFICEGDRHTNHWWQHSTTHALCMLDNQAYRHTLRICNPYCFPTTVVNANAPRCRVISVLPVLFVLIHTNTLWGKLQSLAMLQHVVCIVTTVFWNGDTANEFI